jgi:hypothetical protein
VAQVNNSPEWAPVLMTQHFDALVEKFIVVLREALPSCAPLCAASAARPKRDRTP